MTKKKETAPPEPRQYPGSDEVLPLEPYLKLSAEDLEKAVSEDADDLLSEEKVAGILILERSGPNRTEQVRILCARLGVKSPYEVTKAGPAYTNDARPITAL